MLVLCTNEVQCFRPLPIHSCLIVVDANKSVSSLCICLSGRRAPLPPRSLDLINCLGHHLFISAVASTWIVGRIRIRMRMKRGSPAACVWLLMLILVAMAASDAAYVDSPDAEAIGDNDNEVEM